MGPVSMTTRRISLPAGFGDGDVAMAGLHGDHRLSVPWLLWGVTESSDQEASTLTLRKMASIDRSKREHALK